MNFEDRFKEILAEWLRKKQFLDVAGVLYYSDDSSVGGYYADEVEHSLSVRYRDTSGESRYVRFDIGFPELIRQLSEVS